MFSMCAGLTLKATVFISKINKKEKKNPEEEFHILSNITDFLKVLSSHCLCTLIQGNL